MDQPHPKITFFLDGANECPLVQISGTDFQTSRELYHAIRVMRDRMSGSFGIHEVPGFENCTDPKMYFEISEINVGIQRIPDRNDFTCKLSYDGWIHVEDYLAPFCQHEEANSGFQWLDESSDISLLYSPGGGW